MENNIKVAVVGGTGKAGTFLVSNLLSQGYPIRVLARDPAKSGFENPLIEIVKGDVLFFDDVHKLIGGCGAVISTLGQRKNEPPVFSAAAENIIRAMKTHHISRYVVLTGLSIDTKHDKKSAATKLKSMLMKFLFRKVILDKQNEYRLISVSELDWTVVRVPFIDVTWERRGVETSLPDCGGSMISTADLADFLTAQITDHSYIRKAPFIWNPEKR